VKLDKRREMRKRKGGRKSRNFVKKLKNWERRGKAQRKIRKMSHRKIITLYQLTSHQRKIKILSIQLRFQKKRKKLQKKQQRRPRWKITVRLHHPRMILIRKKIRKTRLKTRKRIQ